LSVTGFFTDSTLCIGCKACEVACKEWNQVPDDGFLWSGLSYDNTLELSHSTWRHVQFLERSLPVAGARRRESAAWEFHSDVCKHCANAGCLEACPTGSIVRTEFGGVYIQPDVCNGCGYCVVSCPFGVPDRNPSDGRAFKCTFCYDRQRGGLEPACAKACPTGSIAFGELETLRGRASRRLEELGEQGIRDASIYDASEGSVGGIHAFSLVRGDPRAYNLPPAPEVPTVHLKTAWRSAAAGALFLLAACAAAFAGSRR
jgi:formate dehydrogenase iron-sulfur subunit